jgi:bifunctional non-homologous end joining protein LigD
LAALGPLRAHGSPFRSLPPAEARGATFVRPEVVVEVRYGQRTPDGRLRFPSFLRLRPDLTAGDVGGGDLTAGDPSDPRTGHDG